LPGIGQKATFRILHDFPLFPGDSDAIGISEIPDAFSSGCDFSVCEQGITFVCACENIPVFSEPDACKAFHGLFLNILFHIVKIFTGSDKPLKRFKMFHKCNFGKTFSCCVRFCPCVVIKTFSLFFGNPDHIPDDITAFRILHCRQIFAFHFRSVCKKLFSSHKISGKIISSSGIETHRTERILYHFYDLGILFLSPVFIVNIHGNAVCLIHSFPDKIFQSAFCGRVHITDITHCSFHLVPQMIFPGFNIFGSQRINIAFKACVGMGYPYINKYHDRKKSQQCHIYQKSTAEGAAFLRHGFFPFQAVERFDNFLKVVKSYRNLTLNSLMLRHNRHTDESQYPERLEITGFRLSPE